MFTLLSARPGLKRQKPKCAYQVTTGSLPDAAAPASLQMNPEPSEGHHSGLSTNLRGLHVEVPSQQTGLTLATSAS